MLTMRQPYLCQSCHMIVSHGSAMYDGATLSSKSKYQVGRGCTNCHANIHGSNHPSGTSFQR